jgi:hypothetical protein
VPQKAEVPSSRCLQHILVVEAVVTAGRSAPKGRRMPAGQLLIAHQRVNPVGSHIQRDQVTILNERLASGCLGNAECLGVQDCQDPVDRKRDRANKPEPDAYPNCQRYGETHQQDPYRLSGPGGERTLGRLHRGRGEVLRSA